MTSILIVEDDRLVRRSLVRTLEGAGVHVIQASTGEQALFILDKLGGRSSFDVVLSDHDLGAGIDGDELIEKIAAIYPTIKRFGMSGVVERWNDSLDAGRILGAFEKMDAAIKLIEECQK